MPFETFHRGQTSVILRVKLMDSSSAIGAPLTGLTSASTGLIISTIGNNEATATTYTVAGSTIETITTLGTYAAPTATKCRFKEVDATNHKGLYEIHLADARFAVTNAKSLVVTISGATNLAQQDVKIPLVDVDPYVAPGSAGGLVVNGSNQAVSFVSLTVSGAVWFQDDLTISGDLAVFDTSGVRLQAAAITSGTFAANAITAAAIASDAAVELASALAGTGSRTVTITVNDGATALQNATVRMVEGANNYTALTNASGIATFNLDDATYTISISKQGYSYAGTTIVVNGTEAATYSMTQISITAPADPALTAAYLNTYDGQGAVEGSVVISFKLEDGVGTTGYSYNQKTFTATSNASTGLLTVNLVKSTSYSARRGNGEWVDFTTGSGSTYALPEVLGTP